MMLCRKAHSIITHPQLDVCVYGVNKDVRGNSDDPLSPFSTFQTEIYQKKNDENFNKTGASGIAVSIFFFFFFRGPRPNTRKLFIARTCPRFLTNTTTITQNLVKSSLFCLQNAHARRTQCLGRVASALGPC